MKRSHTRNCILGLLLMTLMATFPSCAKYQAPPPKSSKVQVTPDQNSADSTDAAAGGEQSATSSAAHQELTQSGDGAFVRLDP